MVVVTGNKAAAHHESKSIAKLLQLYLLQNEVAFIKRETLQLFYCKLWPISIFPRACMTTFYIKKGQNPHLS